MSSSLAAASPASAWRIKLKHAGRDDFVILEKARRPRRHLARQHLPGLRVRRAVVPLLVLVRAEPVLVADVLAAATEIWAYLARLRRAATASRRHLRFGAEVTRRRLRRGDRPLAGRGQRVRPDRTPGCVVSGVGALHIPKTPDLPGLDTFEGDGLPLGALAARRRSRRAATSPSSAPGPARSSSSRPSRARSRSSTVYQRTARLDHAEAGPADRDSRATALRSATRACSEQSAPASTGHSRRAASVHGDAEGAWAGSSAGSRRYLEQQGARPRRCGRS